ncbi:MAG: ribonuclease [Sideroxydans sp.]|jgi:ribonuclease T1
MRRGAQSLWLVWLMLLGWHPVVHAKPVSAALAIVLQTELPPEARVTLQLIKQGGPFPYSRDGVVFSNYEHILPQQPRGHYREYTVPTPGVHHRGARRIVCGIVPECYYTADHYRTFRRIRE